MPHTDTPAADTSTGTVAADWARARCRTAQHEEADLWFAELPDEPDALLAKQICRGCPVRRECGHTAASTGERDAIVAGFHAAWDHEWVALHRWLNLPVPTDANRHPMTCKRCGTAFQTASTVPLACAACRRLVDTGPVQRHLRMLNDDYEWTFDSIGDRIGRNGSAVKAVLRQQRVAKPLADAILALKPAPAAATLRRAS